MKIPASLLGLVYFSEIFLFSAFFAIKESGKKETVRRVPPSDKSTLRSLKLSNRYATRKFLNARSA